MYAIFKKENTVTFKRNGNDSQTFNSSTTTEDIVQTCTIRNTATSCNVKTPTITSTKTPNILGYSTSSDSHVGTYSVNTNIAVSNSMTLYAQSKANQVDRNITFNPNGNASFTYGGETKTSATTYVLCNIPAVYNGATQATTCTATITFPDITANAEKTVL